jgi:hypothetical protein
LQSFESKAIRWTFELFLAKKANWLYIPFTWGRKVAAFSVCLSIRLSDQSKTRLENAQSAYLAES